MKPYESWKNIIESEMNPEQYSQFWKEYLKEEEGIYKKILKLENNIIEGTIKELAEINEVDDITFTGFLDGINPSLETELNLDDYEIDTPISFAIDYEKLYFNMHDAKAKWLYNIKSWNTLLTNEQRKKVKKEYRDSKVIISKVKIGRNDPCPCGSGKKYKKCCMAKDQAMNNA
ncbi:MAG: SEC-C domain-containing protein [Clostridiales bacterium]|nr:SEC-C domain-containing protein [Clostridiales bacterium]